VNPVEAAVRRLDNWQQRHSAAAFVFAVVKKFGDDQGGYLVALLTYFAFLAIFPLLLALTGVLGLVLRDSPHLQQQIVNSALADFPVIGSQLRSQVGLASLHHSGPALIIGIAGALLGGRGLANAVQYTLNSLWNVPKVNRPGFPFNWLRTFGLLGLMGLGTLITAAAASLIASAHLLGLGGAPIHALAFIAGAAVESLLFLAAFRLATAKAVATRDLILGAVLSGIAWQILLSFAGIIVSHDLRHAHAVAGLFGLVLGLMAWMGLQATVTVYALEADVVRAQHLWPRSITQPPLTTGDKLYFTRAVQTETRRPEQEVQVRFSPAADRDPFTGA
jgi:YihY family inner membrane protein